MPDCWAAIGLWANQWFASFQRRQSSLAHSGVAACRRLQVRARWRACPFAYGGMTVSSSACMKPRLPDVPISQALLRFDTCAATIESRCPTRSAELRGKGMRFGTRNWPCNAVITFEVVRPLVAATALALSLAGCERVPTAAAPKPPEGADSAQYEFVGGYPTDATIQKAYDDADLTRAIEAYKAFYPTVSIKGTWDGNILAGAAPNKTLLILHGRPE